MQSLQSSAAFAFLLSMLLIGCQGKGRLSGKEAIPEDAVWVYPRYSNLFAMATTSNDTFLWLRNPSDTNATLGLFCWGKGNNEYKGITRIRKRNRWVVSSAVFAGMLEALHAEQLITAVDNTDYISSPRCHKRIESGNISSVAPLGDVNRELVAKLNADLIIGYFIDQKGRENLEQTGRNQVPVLFFQNFLEIHPLGRAEWIKAFGYLCGKPELAAAQFAEIEEHYLSSVDEVESKVKHKPSVMVNAPFSGTWDIPAGGSYMGRLIEDAGGLYIWSDFAGTGRVPLDIEKVFQKAARAEIWLNPGACRNYNCLMQLDKRLVDFAPIAQKKVFNCTRTLNSRGANAYWEYGVLRPDIVLKDLIAIFHPELQDGHQPVFFEPLTIQ